MKLIFLLDTVDDSPVLLKKIFELAARHQIAHVMVTYDEDERHLELSKDAVYPSDIYFAHDQEKAWDLENELSGGGHCFCYKLVNGEYIRG